MERRLNILTNRAHCGHQYELWKLNCDVSILHGVGDLHDRWNFNHRIFPSNAKWVTVEDIIPEEYDLMICHFDENAIAPRHPMLDNRWGTNFRYMISNYSRRIPTIAICHGYPQTKEQGRLEWDCIGGTILEERRKKLVDFVRHIDIVCNSFKAQETWKFKNSTVIWHGFDPNEFKRGTRERSILCTKEETLKGRPHSRGYYTHMRVKEKLGDILMEETRVVDPSKYRDTPNSNEFAAVRFERYVECLGNYRVFFNSTIHSPMPRQRGEAMLVGCATVNYDSHDISKIVTNGVNGYYSDNEDELVDILKFLDRNPEVACKVGDESRKLSKKIFHTDRYLSDWRKIIKRII